MKLSKMDEEIEGDPNEDYNFETDFVHAEGSFIFKKSINKKKKRKEINK